MNAPSFFPAVEPMADGRDLSRSVVLCVLVEGEEPHLKVMGTPVGEQSTWPRRAARAATLSMGMGMGMGTGMVTSAGGLRSRTPGAGQ